MDDKRVRSEERYDQDNPFARILRGEIPCDRVHESEDALAFHDVNPQATRHAVVVAKGHYETLSEFVNDAPPHQVAGFFRSVCATADELGLAETGFRLVVNQGPDSGQEVPHLHVHVLGGEDLGPILGEVLDPATAEDLRTGPPRAHETAGDRTRSGKIGVRGSSQRAQRTRSA